MGFTSTKQAVKLSRLCLLFFRDCRRLWGKSVSVQLTDEGRSTKIRQPGGTRSSPDRCRRRLGPGQGPAGLDSVQPPKAEPPAGRVEGWPSHGPFRRKGIPCYTYSVRGRRRLGPGQGPAGLDSVQPPKAEPPAGRVEGWPSHGPFRRKGIPCYTYSVSLYRPSAGLQLLER